MAQLTAVPIVALDVSSETEALAMVDAFGPSCRYYKVGGELFTASGPSVVRSIRERGNDVFLDLKFHDIPNTVRQSARSAAASGASMITVHASGGVEMVRAAVEGAGSGCKVMGVTVLTSLDGASLAAAWGRPTLDVAEEVLRLAGICAEAGTHGIVCSGHEAAAIRSTFPMLAPLVPGIRFADGVVHDQARVITPRLAAQAGARYLILGRAVTGAVDLRAAMGRVARELG